MKVLTVVGARPQFVKASAVSRAFLAVGVGAVHEVLLHTGQHYDPSMSNVFFDELGIPAPAHNLEIGSGPHGAMTGRMLEGIEKILIEERPDWVLVYGDTNSTLAGALAACKLHIPIAHVESGLRSYNRRMPEEVNRILTDRLSTLLLCPTSGSVQNLERESVTSGVHLVGDVMYDTALHFRKRAEQSSHILSTLALTGKRYALATCHRAENTDDPDRLAGVIASLRALAKEIPVVLPLHPRTRKLLDQRGHLSELASVTVTAPLPFLDMVQLELNAKLILTDSGGVQKEAFFYGVPCVTLREETEWVETVETGMNRLGGTEPNRILAAAHALMDVPPQTELKPYGDGNAASRIVQAMLESTAPLHRVQFDRRAPQ